MKITCTIPIILFVLLLIQSCSVPKRVVYFEDVNSFETMVNDNGSFEIKFKTDDVVGIHVSTLDKETSAPFNLYMGAQDGGLMPTQIDYIIDEKGEIDFPVIGKIKLAGLSPEEATKNIRRLLSEYIKNPIINIRLKNFTVTILGEVNRPGTYPVNGEKITILEALGYAGDITIKGRKDNVQILRDFDGTKVYYQLNLNSKEALNSPAYYLTQNDVVYVEPNRSGKRASVLDQQASIIVSILSVIITSSVFILTSN